MTLSTIKSLLLQAIFLAILMAPAVERRWWIERLESIQQLIQLRASPLDTEAILREKAFPHFKTLEITRAALLEKPETRRIRLLNTDRGERQRIAEILYPVVIDERARFALELDMQTGRIRMRQSSTEVSPPRKSSEQPLVNQ